VDIEENHISRWFSRVWNEQRCCDQTGEQCPLQGATAGCRSLEMRPATKQENLLPAAIWVAVGVVPMAPPCPTIKE